MVNKHEECVVIFMLFVIGLLFKLKFTCFCQIKGELFFLSLKDVFSFKIFHTSFSNAFVT